HTSWTSTCGIWIFTLALGHDSLCHTGVISAGQKWKRGSRKPFRVGTMQGRLQMQHINRDPDTRLSLAAFKAKAGEGSVRASIHQITGGTMEACHPIKPQA